MWKFLTMSILPTVCSSTGSRAVPNACRLTLWGSSATHHSAAFHFHGVLLLAPVVLPKYLSNVGVESVTVLPQQIA